LSFAFWHVAVGSLADASALRLVIAAGPLGSLAIGGLALVAAVAASALALSLVAAAIGAASLVIGLSALNPFDSGSDGRRWWTLRPTHPQRQRTLALQQLGECALLGRPPADWPREMVRAAAEGEQDGDDAVAGRLFAYVAAMADDAVDEAGRMLSDLRVPTASPYASVVAIEAAYWNAVAGHDRRPLELALESGAALPPRFAVACAAVGRPDDCAMSDAIAWWMPFAIPLAAFATIPVHEALHYVGFRLAGGDLMALRMALRPAVVNVQLDTVRVLQDGRFRIWSRESSDGGAAVSVASSTGTRSANGRQPSCRTRSAGCPASRSDSSVAGDRRFCCAARMVASAGRWSSWMACTRRWEGQADSPSMTSSRATT